MEKRGYDVKSNYSPFDRFCDMFFLCMMELLHPINIRKTLDEQYVRILTV